MKLSNLTAKLTSGIKAKVVTTLAAAAIAGTILAATPAAEAQHFGVGVVIGGPRYYAPPPPPPRYWGYRPYGYGRYYEPAPYGYYHRPHYDRWHRW